MDTSTKPKPSTGSCRPGIAIFVDLGHRAIAVAVFVEIRQQDLQIIIVQQAELRILERTDAQHIDLLQTHQMGIGVQHLCGETHGAFAEIRGYDLIDDLHGQFGEFFGRGGSEGQENIAAHVEILRHHLDLPGAETATLFSGLRADHGQQQAQCSDQQQRSPP